MALEIVTVSKETVANNADPIPAMPVYTFEGKKQSAEFSRGATAAVNLVREAEAHESDDALVITAAYCRKLASLVAENGDFALGAIAATCDYIVSSMACGTPCLDVWTPFNRCWTGENCEIPPDDCMFFEVDGVPYSVEPCLSTLEWYDETGASARPVDSIRGRARAITRAEFDALRWKIGIAKARSEGCPIAALH